jgi:hypothetical protein
MGQMIVPKKVLDFLRVEVEYFSGVGTLLAALEMTV